MHAIAAVVEMAAPAVIAARAAVLAAVGDVQLAAAVAAAQQAGQQRLAPPDRAAAHEALAVGVVGDQPLVPLELRPANVALVVVADQNLPGAAILAEAAHDPLAAGLDRDAASGAAEGIGAGIDRVGQQVVQGVVDRQLPDHLAAFRTVFGRRQRQALLAHPEMDLPDGLQLGELGEDERDRLLDATIGILLDAIVRSLEVADRHGEEQLAAPRLLLQGFERALAEQRQLHLAHRALHAEQQAIVRMPRIVDAVLVDDQRADQAAELEQRVPVAPVAGEPRRLERHDGADPALADRRQQLLEARAGDAGAGAAEIVVDHLDRGPAQGARAIGQAVLPTPALVIVEHLVAGRLANVDEGAAGEMVRRDPGHHRPPRRRGPSIRSGAVARRPPPPAAPAAAAPAWSAGRAEAPSAVPLRRTDPSDCVVLSASPAPLQRGESPAHEAMSASTRARRSASRSTGSRGHATSCCADSTRFRHPRRQQRQGPIRLSDDEVLGARVTLRTDDHDRLAAARMKRIEDPNLGRRTPGSMTLLRPASARPTWRWRSAAPRSSPATRCCSSRRPTWSPRSPGRTARAGSRTSSPQLRQAAAADRRRARLPAVRARRRAPVLPAGLAALRARQPADHEQPGDRRVGHGVRRPGGGDRDPRPAAAPQPRRHDPRRQLPAAREAPLGPAQGRRPSRASWRRPHEPGLPRWVPRSLPPAYSARSRARGRRGPPVDYLDKPAATPTTPGGQFFVSPRGHFPVSLDTEDVSRGPAAPARHARRRREASPEALAQCPTSAPEIVGWCAAL